MTTTLFEDFVNAELPLRIGTVEAGVPASGKLPVYKGVGLLTEAKTLAEAGIAAVADLGNKADKTITVSAGTGLSGGGSLAANRTLSLANTAVTAGNYGSSTLAPVLTIDEQGRIINASTAAIATYTDTNTRATALTGISLATGGVISASDTVLGAFGKLQYQLTNFTLGASGVTAGAYGGGKTKLMAATFNAAGQATAASTTTFSTAYIDSPVSGGITGLGHDVHTVVGAATGCTAFGSSAQKLLTTGSECTAVGTNAQKLITTSRLSTAVGWNSQANNASVLCLTSVGARSMQRVASGGNSVAVGYDALGTASSAQNCIAIGSAAMQNASTGSDNIAIGKSAAANIGAFSGNVIIGNIDAGYSTNCIAIASGSPTATIKIRHDGTNWLLKGAVFQDMTVGATLTHTANSQLVVEATSNSLLTFKLKGTDGVVRTATLALV